MSSELSKGQRTREVIIDAAKDLFVEQGYHGTSMRQVAERAGIALGGIYNHFAGKEEIFEAVFEAYHPYHLVLPALNEAKGESMEELVRDAFSILVQGFNLRSEFLNLMFIEIVEFESKHFPSIFEKLFPEGMKFAQRVFYSQGELRSIPIPIMIRVFIGLFFSYIMTEIMIEQIDYPDIQMDAEKHFVDIFLHGILASE